MQAVFFNPKSRPFCNLSCALQDQDTKIDNRDQGDHNYVGDHESDHEYDVLNFSNLGFYVFPPMKLSPIFCLQSELCIVRPGYKDW